MSNLTFTIEINKDDARLNEIPVHIVVKNTGKIRGKIISLTPNIPRSVKIEDKIEPYQEENKKRFKALCSDLSQIIRSMIRQNETRRISEEISYLKRDYLTNTQRPSFFLRLFRPHVPIELRKEILRLEQTELVSFFEVNTIRDALYGYETYFAQLDESNNFRNVYKGKLEQLRDIEESNDPYSELITIDAGSFYSRIYVLKFKRGSLTTRIYNIAFDIIYIEEDGSKENRTNLSTSINITPQPLSLTIFAVLASLLGVILKYGMDTSFKSTSFLSLFNELYSLLVQKGITSVIIALLFFNIYEYVDIGKRIKIGVNWRSALLIGILSGLFGDRLIEALKVLLGK